MLKNVFWWFSKNFQVFKKWSVSIRHILTLVYSLKILLIHTHAKFMHHTISVCVYDLNLYRQNSIKWTNCSHKGKSTQLPASFWKFRGRRGRDQFSSRQKDTKTKGLLFFITIFDFDGIVCFSNDLLKPKKSFDNWSSAKYQFIIHSNNNGRGGNHIITYELFLLFSLECLN